MVVGFLGDITGQLAEVSAQLAELGQTYIYGQTDDGWKIHATIAHGPETVVGCVEE